MSALTETRERRGTMGENLVASIGTGSFLVLQLYIDLGYV